MRNCVEPLQEGLQALRKRDVLTARRRLGNLHSVQNRDRKRTQKRLFPLSTCRRRRRHAQAHALVRLRARRTTAHCAARACSTTPTSLARWPHRCGLSNRPIRFVAGTAGNHVLAVHTRSVGSGRVRSGSASSHGCCRWLHGPHSCSDACAPECCSPLLLTINGWYISRSQRECSNI